MPSVSSDIDGFGEFGKFGENGYTHLFTGVAPFIQVPYVVPPFG